MRARGDYSFITFAPQAVRHPNLLLAVSFPGKWILVGNRKFPRAVRNPFLTALIRRRVSGKGSPHHWRIFQNSKFYQTNPFRCNPMRSI